MELRGVQPWRRRVESCNTPCIEYLSDIKIWEEETTPIDKYIDWGSIL